MGEAMFHAHALAQLRATGPAFLEFAQLLLQGFVVAPGDRSASARPRLRGLRAARLSWSFRNFFCKASLSPMETVLPRPDAAWVHCARSGQGPQASGSNST